MQRRCPRYLPPGELVASALALVGTIRGLPRDHVIIGRHVGPEMVFREDLLQVANQDSPSLHRHTFLPRIQLHVVDLARVADRNK